MILLATFSLFALICGIDAHDEATRNDASESSVHVELSNAFMQRANEHFESIDRAMDSYKSGRSLKASYTGPTGGQYVLSSPSPHTDSMSSIHSYQVSFSSARMMQTMLDRHLPSLLPPLGVTVMEQTVAPCITMSLMWQ